MGGSNGEGKEEGVMETLYREIANNQGLFARFYGKLIQ